MLHGWIPTPLLRKRGIKMRQAQDLRRTRGGHSFVKRNSPGFAVEADQLSECVAHRRTQASSGIASSEIATGKPRLRAQSLAPVARHWHSYEHSQPERPGEQPSAPPQWHHRASAPAVSEALPGIQYGPEGRGTGLRHAAADEHLRAGKYVATG